MYQKQVLHLQVQGLKDTNSSEEWETNRIILDFNNLLEAMIERINEEATGMRFNCKSCQKKTSSKQSILRHVETHLDMVHSCNLCRKQSKTRVGLAQHYAKFHGDQVQSPWTMN